MSSGSRPHHHNPSRNPFKSSSQPASKEVENNLERLGLLGGTGSHKSKRKAVEFQASAADKSRSLPFFTYGATTQLSMSARAYNENCRPLSAITSIVAGIAESQELPIQSRERSEEGDSPHKKWHGGRARPRPLPNKERQNLHRKRMRCV